MSLDLEDRLERGLTDLARQAPVPDEWPDLEAPIITFDRRSTGRPRLVTGFVAAAAAIVVIATVAFVVNRDPGASPTRTAAAPSSTDASAASAALGGRWSPTGPRLTDEQLGSIVATVTLPDGSEEVVPRSGFDVDDQGPRPDRTQRVIDVSVVRTDAAGFSWAHEPSGEGHLTAEQRLAIIQYLASISPPGALPASASTPTTSGAEVLLVVVRTELRSETSTNAGSACHDPSSGRAGCEPSALDFVWVFVSGGPTAHSSGMVARFPHVDLLAGLGPVGRWAPDVFTRSSTTRPTATTSASPQPPASPPPTTVPPSPSSTVPYRSASPAPTTTVAPDSERAQP